ncbi:MAG: PadR family transcriptional regulator [Halobacteriaceae archaeon]
MDWSHQRALRQAAEDADEQLRTDAGEDLAERVAALEDRVDRLERRTRTRARDGEMRADGGRTRTQIAERAAQEALDGLDDYLKRACRDRDSASDEDIEELVRRLHHDIETTVRTALKHLAADHHDHDLVTDGGHPDAGVDALRDQCHALAAGEDVTLVYHTRRGTEKRLAATVQERPNDEVDLLVETDDGAEYLVYEGYDPLTVYHVRDDGHTTVGELTELIADTDGDAVTDGDEEDAVEGDDASEALPATRWYQLHAFQRDVLLTLAAIEDQDVASYGLAVKRELETRYGEAVNHGRLYPNLDDLVEAGLVEKASLDKRTNEYTLTDTGRALVEAHATTVYRTVNGDAPALADGGQNG